MIFSATTDRETGFRRRLRHHIGGLLRRFVSAVGDPTAGGTHGGLDGWRG